MPPIFGNPIYIIKENSRLAWIAAKKMGADKLAMVLGNTIHLHKASKDEFLSDGRWLKHELCHIKQFQQHGYLGFLVKYLWESMKHGYHNNKFEVEAREAEKEQHV